MATERHVHQAWADKEIAALIELGTNPIDAEKRISWVLDNLPPGADPATYIFPAHSLWQEPATKQDDSASAYIASDDTPNKYKRVLTSREED